MDDIAGMSYDMMRSLGDRRPWILMEQATNNVNWRHRNAVKPPGAMRLGSYQAIARGADGIMFFQWRASKSGSEKHHSGMVPHIGTDSRVWREVKEFGNELPRLNAIFESRKCRCCHTFGLGKLVGARADSKPSNDLKLIQRLTRIKSRYTSEMSPQISFILKQIFPMQSYPAPNLYLATIASGKHQPLCENGGTLVMSFFSGITMKMNIFGWAVSRAVPRYSRIGRLCALF
jgi:beta-galactosidase